MHLCNIRQTGDRICYAVFYNIQLFNSILLKHCANLHLLMCLKQVKLLQQDISVTGAGEKDDDHSDQAAASSNSDRGDKAAASFKCCN